MACAGRKAALSPRRVADIVLACAAAATEVAAAGAAGAAAGASTGRTEIET